MRLEALSEEDLVALWFHANAELHRRGAKLWHAGDLAEILVAAAIGGQRATSNVQRGYDVLAIVLFAEDMQSVKAWKMPPEVVIDFGRWYPDRRQYRLTRTQKLLRDPRVEVLELKLPSLPEW